MTAGYSNTLPDFSRGDGLPHGSSRNDEGLCAYEGCVEYVTHQRATAYGRLVGYCRRHAALAALVFDGVRIEGGSQYQPVEPREHDQDCRRGNPGFYGGLDCQRCGRCRQLWARLEQAAL